MSKLHGLSQNLSDWPPRGPGDKKPWKSICSKFLNRAMLFLVVLMLTPAGISFAHKASDSYLKIKGDQSELSIQWDIAIKDLELLIGVDQNQNGEVTWGELKSKQDEIAAHALSRLHIRADGQSCDLRLIQMKVTDHSDGSYAVLILSTGVAGDADILDIDYDFLFEEDPTHRGLVLFENGQLASTHVLSPTDATLELITGKVSLWGTFVDYVQEGVWHIWIGLDHILFLISLLLPAVLIRRQKWEPVGEFGPAFKSVLKIVTVFTIAHSITLWLAVMEYVVLPSQWVESTIAFSIIVTAANNLFPFVKIPGWAIAFFFGLIHGFGFANVLIDLGLSSVNLAVSLFGFNVGVELGQLAIVAVFLPVAFLFRKTKFYELAILKLGSVAIAIVAIIWMVERIGNFEIIGI